MLNFINVEAEFSLWFQFLSDGYQKDNSTHRNLLLCLLMTSCDLSDQTKNWKNTKKIAVSVFIFL